MGRRALSSDPHARAACAPPYLDVALSSLRAETARGGAEVHQVVEDGERPQRRHASSPSSHGARYVATVEGSGLNAQPATPASRTPRARSSRSSTTTCASARAGWRRSRAQPPSTRTPTSSPAASSPRWRAPRRGGLRARAAPRHDARPRRARRARPLRMGCEHGDPALGPRTGRPLRPTSLGGGGRRAGVAGQRLRRPAGAIGPLPWPTRASNTAAPARTPAFARSRVRPGRAVARRGGFDARRGTVPVARRLELRNARRLFSVATLAASAPAPP